VRGARGRTGRPQPRIDPPLGADARLHRTRMRDARRSGRSG